MKPPSENIIRFNINDALQTNSVGFFVDEGPGHWIYPLGVVIELNSAVYSQDDIPLIENPLREELRKNRRAIVLQIVSEHPLKDEAAVVLGTEIPEDQPFRVRAQSFAEAFANHLRREGFIPGDRLVARVRVRFHKAACEEISGHSVDTIFFRSLLANYSQDDTFYRIEESISPVDGGYAISELEEVPVNLPGGVGDFEVTPFEIRNASCAVVHLEIHSLQFSSINGVALLPGETIRLTQRLDAEAFKRQIEGQIGLNQRQTNGDLVCPVTLPESEFDLLPRRSIVFKPLSLPFRPRATTRVFPSEEEKYQLLYVGARMRPLRTEIYVSDLFYPNFNPPLAIAVGYTNADQDRWYAFNQPCELQVAEPRRSFRILPGYLFKADSDQYRIRNIHLAFRPPHTRGKKEAFSRCEIMLESSEQETFVMVQQPKPVVVAAFSEHEEPKIRLGPDRFQLRIERSYRRRASRTRTESTREQTAEGITAIHGEADREAVLNVREGLNSDNKPWKSIALDEPFIVGNHILRVSAN